VLDALIAARGVHVAASVAAAGAIFFRLWVAAPALRAVDPSLPWRAARDRELCAIAWASLAVVIVSALVWLLLVAADVSGHPVIDALSGGTVTTLLTSTRFGHAWTARLAAALVLGVYLLRAKPDAPPLSAWGCAAALPAAVLLGALVRMGHGGATAGAAGVVQLAADAAHAVAAGVWVGGLVPFALFLAAVGRAAEASALAAARAATRRFSNLGLASVAALLATGLINTIFLAGTIEALLGTPYGQLLVLKICLFLAMVALAAVNRLKLTPELSTARATRAARQLQHNAASEAGLGLAILVIVGALGNIPPARHVEPWWPLPFRLDGAALASPQVRVNALLAAVALALLAASLIALFFRRRPHAAIVAALIAFAGLLWNLQFLLVPAFPTSFYHSPTGFTLASIARGRALFAVHCAGCHGATGRGNGPNALALDIATSDLTATHVYAHSDGDLFWFIGHGTGDTMPGFGDAIDDMARWNLIDFIHATADAARLQRHAPGEPNAFPAPNFTAECGDESKSLEDLRGRFVRLAAGAGGMAPASAADVVTILVPLDSADAAGGACAVDDPDADAALAVYRGDAAIDGTQLLIDPQGRLRALWFPGIKPDWNDAAALARVIARLRVTPALGRPAPTDGHAHGH